MRWAALFLGALMTAAGHCNIFDAPPPFSKPCHFPEFFGLAPKIKKIYIFKKKVQKITNRRQTCPKSLPRQAFRSARRLFETFGIYSSIKNPENSVRVYKLTLGSVSYAQQFP